MDFELSAEHKLLKETAKSFADNEIMPGARERDREAVFCFLCIGLSTRFADLAHFGLKPFWAFTVGVIVNVPLGIVLSAITFKDYWMKIG